MLSEVDNSSYLPSHKMTGVDRYPDTTSPLSSHSCHSSEGDEKSYHTTSNHKGKRFYYRINVIAPRRQQHNHTQKQLSQHLNKLDSIIKYFDPLLTDAFVC